VGGAGVSQGYLHRPALTAARFIPNPYGAGQLYRTGDLARWRPDGSLEYLGRIDHQVKLRGFRIELGEIEGVLSQHPAVQEVVVSVREDGNPLGAGEQRLVAYVVQAATRDLHPAELRRYVQSKLPEYMLPSDFVVLAALPLTANGKVDRKALPMPNRQADRIRVTRPRTWTEQQLVQIWEKLLAIHPVGVEDHFFELGGHSLLAVQLLTRIQQTFGQTLPLRTLFAHPTIAELALALHQDTSALTASTLVAFQPQGAQPPLYCLPGVGGGVLHFYPLAQAWGKQQPLYALESVGLDGKTTPFATVEAAATYQVQQLQRHQPQGPYYLAGHSYGGFVAFAMAQQLLKAGAEIGALCLLDTEAPTGKVTALDEVSIILLYERLFLEEYALSPTLSAAQLLPLTSEARLLAFKAALEAAKVLPLHSALDLVRGIVNVITADLQATAYLPTHSVRLPIHLFVATEDKQNPEVAQAMLVGWAKYGDVTVHEVPGAHMTMLYPPHVQTLASELAAVLASVTGDGI
jgi:thioesterase domain-containing protein/acyl carrier protein